MSCIFEVFERFLAKVLLASLGLLTAISSYADPRSFHVSQLSFAELTTVLQTGAFIQALDSTQFIAFVSARHQIQHLRIEDLAAIVKESDLKEYQTLSRENTTSFVGPGPNCAC